MHSASYKADNASDNPVVQPASMVGSAPYSGREFLSRDMVNDMLKAAKQSILPRVNLEDRSLSQRVFSTAQPLVGGGGYPQETVALSFWGPFDPMGGCDRESTISPDEKDILGVYSNNTPSWIEKKKMKRFRLTYDQTRFLMSEFIRQPHPDASHRIRLSREIPGLTPRQVQVWFQNRRAKLKNLTPNDRERMLRSRALPEDFDTGKLLRTPLEGKPSAVTPVVSPQGNAVPTLNVGALGTLCNKYFHLPNEDGLLSSPSSPSISGIYILSTGERNDGLPVSAYAGIQMHNRFKEPQANHLGLSHIIPPIEYATPWHPCGMTAYDQHQSFEGSVSPTDAQGTYIAYNMNNLSSQQRNYELEMGFGLPTQGRSMNTVQNLRVAAAQDYRPYFYDTTASPLDTSIPYTQDNVSNLSFLSSNKSYNYPNYIQQ